MADYAFPERTWLDEATLDAARPGAARLDDMFDGIPTRAEMLRAFHAALVAPLPAEGPRPEALREARIAHQFLRQVLHQDAALAALLAHAPVAIGLGRADHAPFRLTRSGILLLPPALLGCAPALAAAARWGLEAAHFFRLRPVPAERQAAALGAVLRHGQALIGQLPAAARERLLELLPAGCEGVATEELRAWLAGCIEVLAGCPAGGAADPGELCLPMEQILVAGGDSRLAVDAATGLSRYGTAPRPRPEAVHFSSSTASSVSDYGFMLCDALRQDLLHAALSGTAPPAALHAACADAVIATLAAAFGVGEADLALAPSGSDTELISVLLALAGDAAPLTNILIAPEESGRGVALAAAGCYFDAIGATGGPVAKGAAAWPGRDIRVQAVNIRGDAGEARPAAAIAAELRGLVQAALAGGRRVLLHMLACSKTGLAAPGTELLAELVALAPGRVDVVVDACQMRNPLHEIAAWVRAGWMVQVSGSKFFTGPPFSGALLIPAALRGRAGAVAALLAAAPAVARPEFWSAGWRRALPAPAATPASFGLLFRWVPALAEAALLREVPEALAALAFAQFRARLERRLALSPALGLVTRLETGSVTGSAPFDLARQSIVCFDVRVPDAAGGVRQLGAAACQCLFELLNRDMRGRIAGLAEGQHIVAAQCAHIGQPVGLHVGAGAPEHSVLRLVIGARFFTFIAYAGAGLREAALESEISDAIRAIDKLELLAAHWREIGAGDLRGA